ncbi:MAG: L-threonylcarbamoyladenylate synthase [Lutibacter sp.]
MILFAAEIEKSLSVLKSGKILIYPTDTVWGIGCDATSEKAVAKIFKIKQRQESKSLIILVSSVKMLKNYIKSIPSEVLDLLKNIKKPTSIIYSNPVGLAKNVIADDNTIAIRIPKNEFCVQLIEQFGKPIVSTSANISEEPAPKSYSEISTSILDTVDYIVNLQRQAINENPSQLIKVNSDGSLKILRP